MLFLSDMVSFLKSNHYCLEMEIKLLTELIDDALHILKENKYKITKQRKSLLTYLSQYEESYVDVTVVDDYMRNQYPGMSHNTIYRNIKEFKEMGLVEQRMNGERACVKYQCDFSHKHHHHFICTSCSKVVELDSCPLGYFENQLPGYKIEEHKFELHGICDECQEKLVKN